MPKKKLAYYYDTETCTYHRAKVTSWTIAQKLGIFGILVLVVTLVTTRIFNVFFTDSRSVIFVNEQEALYKQIASLNDRLDISEEHLADLLSKDNDIYLPIVGGELISEAKWQAGAGGSNLFDANRNDKATEVFIRLEKLRHQTKILSKSYALVESKVLSKEIELKNVPSILPVNGTLMSGFGMRRHPISGTFKFHTGLDFGCDIGTPLYATGDGIVTNAGYGESGYGMYVDIDHKNGYMTKFAHMSSTKVAVGAAVKRGQLIGYSGNTGLSSGPHLHYEIMLKGEKIDPIDFFYMDLSPTEYRRLSLDPGTVTKEAVKKKLDVPAMD